MSALLEDYGLIGDGRSAALVCRDGSIDWLCWPRFDSEACFAALLGSSDHGRWLIAPRVPTGQASRRYRDGTLVLETDMACATGTVRIIDFMPDASPTSAVIRTVVGLSGTVPMRLGLLSEEYNTTGKHLAGNFPQALSHLALINTTLALSGPQMQRGMDIQPRVNSSPDSATDGLYE